MSQNAKNELNAAIRAGIFYSLDHLTDVCESRFVTDATKNELRAAFAAGQLNGIDRLGFALTI